MTLEVNHYLSIKNHALSVARLHTLSGSLQTTPRKGFFCLLCEKFRKCSKHEVDSCRSYNQILAYAVTGSSRVHSLSFWKLCECPSTYHHRGNLEKGPKSFFSNLQDRRQIFTQGRFSWFCFIKTRKEIISALDVAEGWQNTCTNLHLSDVMCCLTRPVGNQFQMQT